MYACELITNIMYIREISPPIEEYLETLSTNSKLIDISHYYINNDIYISIFPNLSRFIELEILYCNKNNLSSLTYTLPSSLIHLNCSNNKLTSLPQLLTYLPNLKILNCGNNNLTLIPVLPPSLIQLHCEYNQLTSLPSLNRFLTTLNCSFNQLTELPLLNESLRWLYCNNNKLKYLPPFNNSLYVLNCAFNELITLPILNDCLYTLNCESNKLIYLPSFPSSLYMLFCSKNKLTCLPYLNDLKRLESDFYSIPNYITITPEIIKNNDKHNRFREIFYLSKFKLKIISWLWKSKKEGIESIYHPDILHSMINRYKDDQENPEFIEWMEKYWWKVD